MVRKVVILVLVVMFSCLFFALSLAADGYKGSGINLNDVPRDRYFQSLHKIKGLKEAIRNRDVAKFQKALQEVNKDPVAMQILYNNPELQDQVIQMQVYTRVNALGLINKLETAIKENDQKAFETALKKVKQDMVASRIMESNPKLKAYVKRTQAFMQKQSGGRENIRESKGTQGGKPRARTSKKFAKKAAIEVTDHLHPEAYGASPREGHNIIHNKNVPVRDPEQLRHVMEYKFNKPYNEALELSEKAAELRKQGRYRKARLYQAKAEAKRMEAMRQTVKQWDKQVKPRFKAAGAKTDEKLEKAIEIMRQVGQQKITPAEAERRLMELGETPKTVTQKMASKLEHLEKLRGRGVEFEDPYVKNVMDKLGHKKGQYADRAQELLDKIKSKAQTKKPGTQRKVTTASLSAPTKGEQVKSGLLKGVDIAGNLATAGTAVRQTSDTIGKALDEGREPGAYDAGKIIYRNTLGNIIEGSYETTKGATEELLKKSKSGPLFPGEVELTYLKHAGKTALKSAKGIYDGVTKDLPEGIADITTWDERQALRDMKDNMASRTELEIQDQEQRLKKIEWYLDIPGLYLYPGKKEKLEQLSKEYQEKEQKIRRWIAALQRHLEPDKYEKDKKLLEHISRRALLLPSSRKVRKVIDEKHERDKEALESGKSVNLDDELIKKLSGSIDDELIKSLQDESTESQDKVHKDLIAKASGDGEYCNTLWVKANSCLENYDLSGAKAVLQDAHLHGCNFPFDQLNARINQLDYCMHINQDLADALEFGDLASAQKALRDAREANCNLNYEAYEKRINDLMARARHCKGLLAAFEKAAQNKDVSSMQRIIAQGKSSGCRLPYGDMEQLVSQVQQNIKASHDNARMMAALSSFMNAMGQVTEQAQKDTEASTHSSPSGCRCPRRNEPNEILYIDTNNNPKDTTYLYCKYDKLGTLSYECPYVNGKEHGLARSYYYGTLNVLREVKYRNGMIDGFRREYYKDGTLSAEWRYENGNLISLRRYRRDGSLSDECFYRNRKLVVQKGYDKHGRVRSVRKNGKLVWTR